MFNVNKHKLQALCGANIAGNHTQIDNILSAVKRNSNEHSICKQHIELYNYKSITPNNQSTHLVYDICPATEIHDF